MNCQMSVLWSFQLVATFGSNRLGPWTRDESDSPYRWDRDMLDLVLGGCYTMEREGTARVLDRIDGIRVRASVACEEVVQTVAEVRPNVLVVFVRPFEDFKPDRIREVQTESPHTEIVILSPRTDRQALVRVLNAGVDGHLSIEAGSEELLEAIREVGRGRQYVGPRCRDSVIDEMLQSPSHIPRAEPHEELTSREREVLVHFREGRTASEIADRLFISDRTVQKHIQTARTKLGLEGPHELRCYLLREGREIGSDYEQA